MPAAGALPEPREEKPPRRLPPADSRRASHRYKARASAARTLTSRDIDRRLYLVPPSVALTFAHRRINGMRRDAKNAPSTRCKSSQSVDRVFPSHRKHRARRQASTEKVPAVCGRWGLICVLIPEISMDRIQRRTAGLRLAFSLGGVFPASCPTHGRAVRVIPTAARRRLSPPYYTVPQRLGDADVRGELTDLARAKAPCPLVEAGQRQRPLRPVQTCFSPRRPCGPGRRRLALPTRTRHRFVVQRPVTALAGSVDLTQTALTPAQPLRAQIIDDDTRCPCTSRLTRTLRDLT